jgi:hypothetical protein
MTVRKNAKTKPAAADSDSLDELFGGLDDSNRVDFSDIDWIACGRLIAAATRRGAFVGLYIASVDNTLCLSVGVGEKRKRYQADDAEQFDQIVNGVSIKLGVPRLLPPPKP